MTLSALKQIARFCGYIVFNYSKAKTILITLNLWDRAKVSKGITLRTADYTIIFIDDSKTEERQLFTLAHELGHIVLNHSINCGETAKEKEREADNFARALLTCSNNKIN